MLLMRLQRPKRLLKMITHFIDHEMKLTHTSILFYDSQKQHFSFIHSRGNKRMPTK